MRLVLHVSVDVGVPEQRLVSIAPEKLLLSNVLVVVLSRPLLITEMSHVFSVVSVVDLHLGDRNGSQSHHWEGNEKSDFLPQGGHPLGVVGGFLHLLLECFTSLLVVLVLEGVLLDELGHVTVAAGVESLERALGGSSKHLDDEE